MRQQSQPSLTEPRSTQMRNPRELDACGIGFVADAHGRSSRQIVTAALRGLANVKHRGAVAADARTSDGTGLLTTIPAAIFGEGVGVVGLFVRGADPTAAVEAAATAEGLEVIEWRTPPTDETALGVLAAGSRPGIVQALIRPTDAARAEIDRLVASGAEVRLGDVGQRGPRAPRLPPAPTHRRHHGGHLRGVVLVPHHRPQGPRRRRRAAPTSTSTSPTSASRPTSPSSTSGSAPTRCPPGSGPSRSACSCHNGEINTIGGNENRMRARARLGTAEVGLGPEELFRPVIDPDASDSGMLDEAAELLMRGGRHLSHVMAMLVPEAWEETRDLDPEVRGFYEYHSALMEPWDGPAGVIFTDGVRVGAVLDRNGLRPLRYALCEDGLVVCASEMGAVDVSGHGTVDRGRLGPGHMLVVSPSFGAVRNTAVKEHLAAEAPYAQWAADGFVPVPPGEPVADPPADLLVRQAGQRLHQGGAGDGAQAHGHRRLRAHLRHGRRLPPAADGRPCPAGGPLPAPAIRPGHQPADRPAARAAGDEPAHAARAPHAAAARAGRRHPVAHPRVVLPLSRPRSTRCSRPGAARSRWAASTPASPSPRGPTACGPRSRRRPPPPTHSSPRAPASS